MAAQQVLRRLDLAFTSFFKRRKEGAKPGFPAKGAGLLRYVSWLMVPSSRTAASVLSAAQSRLASTSSRPTAPRVRRAARPRASAVLTARAASCMVTGVWGLSASGAADSFPTTVIAEPNPRSGSPSGPRGAGSFRSDTRVLPRWRQIWPWHLSCRSARVLLSAPSGQSKSL